MNEFQSYLRSLPEHIRSVADHDPAVVRLDDGALLVEWSKEGKKLAFFLETDLNDSSWVFACKESGVQGGPLQLPTLFRVLSQISEEGVPAERIADRLAHAYLQWAKVYITRTR